MGKSNKYWGLADTSAHDCDQEASTVNETKDSCTNYSWLRINPVELQPAVLSQKISQKYTERGQKYLKAGKSTKYCRLSSSAVHDCDQEASTVNEAGYT